MFVSHVSIVDSFANKFANGLQTPVKLMLVEM